MAVVDVRIQGVLMSDQPERTGMSKKTFWFVLSCVLVVCVGGPIAALAYAGFFLFRHGPELARAIPEVRIDSCQIDEAPSGWAAIGYTVNNRSDHVSTITVDLVVKDGKGVRVGEGIGRATYVPAGESESHELRVHLTASGGESCAVEGFQWT